jgi:hypothetical protein
MIMGLEHIGIKINVGKQDIKFAQKIIVAIRKNNELIFIR